MGARARRRQVFPEVFHWGARRPTREHVSVNLECLAYVLDRNCTDIIYQLLQVGSGEWSRLFVGALSRTLKLCVPNVDTMMEGGYAVFGRGWEAFAASNRINEGDFGVFTYHSSSMFDVRLFNGVGTEKYVTFVIPNR